MNRDTRTEVILKHKFGSLCPICKTKKYPLIFDHIYPKSRGGSDKPINLRLICTKCNTIKADRVITDKYLRKHLEVVKNEKCAT